MKNTEKRIQLRHYNRRYDPNSNSYFDSDGTYVVTEDVKVGSRWQKRVVARYRPEDFPDGADLFFQMDQDMYEEDHLEDNVRAHSDRVFADRLGRWEKGGDSLTDPWDQVSYAAQSPDLCDLLFPEDEQTDERLERLQKCIQKLQPQQIDLIYMHLGALMTLEEIRTAENAQTGKHVTQQAYSDRWSKIVKRMKKMLEDEDEKRLE